MSAKAIIRGALILALCSGPAAYAASEPVPANPESAGQPPAAAQAPATPPVERLPPPAAAESTTAGSLQPSAPVGAQGLPPGSVVDPWIAYPKPGCCGPLGANGPIGSEWFLNYGPSIPSSGGVLKDTLATGWMTEVGARALLFNQDTDAAWTASTGVSYTYNNGNHSDRAYTIAEGFLVNGAVQFADVLVTTRDYQRWSFNAALGREWYLFNPAYRPGWHFRIGGDTGGRYGYGKVDLNDLTALPNTIFYRHKSDVFGGVFISLHSDLEIPICCGSSTFITGVRAEWSYNWTDVLPTQRWDLQDVNILWHIGFRY